MKLMRNFLIIGLKKISNLSGRLLIRHKWARVNVGEGSKINAGAQVEGFLENIVIGKKVSLSAHSLISCADEDSRLEIGDGTIIKSFAMLMTYPRGFIKIGRNCSVNPFCVLYGHGGLEIGDNVRIATHTVMIPANHEFVRIDVPITEQGLNKQGIKIGNNVWIGAGVTILDGCVIGDGVVIGAGAVITKSIPENTVVAGVPGRVLKHRVRGESR
jgi:acetyltransferase-like isoleucine patch superfamily enzyme